MKKPSNPEILRTTLDNWKTARGFKKRTGHVRDLIDFVDDDEAEKMLASSIFTSSNTALPETVDRIEEEDPKTSSDIHIQIGTFHETEKTEDEEEEMLWCKRDSNKVEDNSAPGKEKRSRTT